MHARTPALALLALLLVCARVLGAEGGYDPGVAAPDLPGPERPEREDAALHEAEPRLDCRQSETALCLLDDRFRVEASWSTRAGGPGAVRDPQVSDSTGLLRPFSGSRVKMLVKMLDACRVRGLAGFWVFAAATADLEVVLSITDTVTGRRRDYLAHGGAPGLAVVDVTTFNDCR